MPHTLLIPGEKEKEKHTLLSSYKSIMRWQSSQLAKSGNEFGTILFGLVRDGAAWDKDYGLKASTDAWYTYSYDN